MPCQIEKMGRMIGGDEKSVFHVPSVDDAASLDRRGWEKA
jgi:hypothetical protein